MYVCFSLYNTLCINDTSYSMLKMFSIYIKNNNKNDLAEKGVKKRPNGESVTQERNPRKVLRNYKFLEFLLCLDNREQRFISI